MWEGGRGSGGRSGEGVVSVAESAALGDQDGGGRAEAVVGGDNGERATSPREARASIGGVGVASRVPQQLAGAKVGCLFHKVLGCEHNKEGWSNEEEMTRSSLAECANKEPLIPLFTGVPLLPYVGTHPEYGERFGPGGKGRW